MIAVAIHVDGDVRRNATHVVHNLVRNLVVHNLVLQHAQVHAQAHAAQHHVASQDAQHTHQIAARSQVVLHALRDVRLSAHLVVHNWCVERPQVEMNSGSEGYPPQAWITSRR